MSTSLVQVEEDTRVESELSGEIQMLKEVLWPVTGSFDGIEKEYEMVGLTGVECVFSVNLAPTAPNRIRN